MKKLLFLLVVSVTFIACNNSKDEKTNSSEADTSKEKPDGKSSSVPEGGRYGIKSAKVVMVSGLPKGMGNTVTTQYFDNYGKEVYTETTMEFSMKGMPAQPKQISLMQGDYMYTWAEGAKTGTKTKMMMNDDLKNMDYEKMGKEMAEKMNVKKTGNETWLGRSCDVYEMDNPQLGKSKVLTWKNIPMRMEATAMGMKVTTEVKELEESPSIDASKFKVPSGIEFKDMTSNKPVM